MCRPRQLQNRLVFSCWNCDVSALILAWKVFLINVSYNMTISSLNLSAHKFWHARKASRRLLFVNSSSYAHSTHGSPNFDMVDLTKTISVKCCCCCCVCCGEVVEEERRGVVVAVGCSTACSARDDEEAATAWQLDSPLPGLPQKGRKCS